MDEPEFPLADSDGGQDLGRLFSVEEEVDEEEGEELKDEDNE